MPRPVKYRLNNDRDLTTWLEFKFLVTKVGQQTHWALTHEASSLTSATHLSGSLFPLVTIRKAVAITTVRRPRGPWFHGLVALFKGRKKNRPARGTTVPVVPENGN